MLRIHFLNVGNGDCIILQYETNLGDVFGVIDCNRPSFRRSPALAKLEELGAEKLSFVCMTHPDMDHYTGLFDVLTHYSGKIGEFYTGPLGNILKNPELLKKLSRQYIDIAKTQDDPEITRNTKELVKIIKFATEHFLPNNWKELSGEMNQIAPEGFSGIGVYSILPPKKLNGDLMTSIKSGGVVLESDTSVNKWSAAFLIRYGGVNVILGGDGTSENWFDHRRWQRRTGNGIESSCVKLPHHGSGKDCDADTLENLFIGDDCGSEAVAIVSADGKRHPHQDVMSWISSNKVRCYCTNYFRGWGSTVTELFTDKSLDPELVRRLNECGHMDLTRRQPCKGDICLTIDHAGTVSVETELDTSCLCDPGIVSLLN